MVGHYWLDHYPVRERFLSVKKLPNTACTGRLGLAAFYGVVAELWQFSVSEPCSPQPPVTQAVRRLDGDTAKYLENDYNVSNNISR